MWFIIYVGLLRGAFFARQNRALYDSYMTSDMPFYLGSTKQSGHVIRSLSISLLRS